MKFQSLLRETRPGFGIFHSLNCFMEFCPKGDASYPPSLSDPALDHNKFIELRHVLSMPMLVTVVRILNVGPGGMERVLFALLSMFILVA